MKTHFFVLRDEDGRKSFLTLPGQTIGRGNTVIPGILVKPRKGVEALFRKYKKESPDGTFFFTRSLKKAPSCYSAEDIEPISVLYDDTDKLVFPETEKARLEWEQYKLQNDL